MSTHTVISIESKCDHYMSGNDSYRTTTPQYQRAHYSTQFDRPVLLGSDNSEEGPRNFEYDAETGRCLAYSDVFDPLQEGSQEVPSTVHLTAYGEEMRQHSQYHQGSRGLVQTGWVPSIHQGLHWYGLGQGATSQAQMAERPVGTVRSSSTGYTNLQGQVQQGEWTLYPPQPSSVWAEQIPSGYLGPGSSTLGISLMLLSSFGYIVDSA